MRVGKLAVSDKREGMGSTLELSKSNNPIPNKGSNNIGHLLTGIGLQYITRRQNTKCVPRCELVVPFAEIIGHSWHNLSAHNMHYNTYTYTKLTRCSVVFATRGTFDLLLHLFLSIIDHLGSWGWLLA